MQLEVFPVSPLFWEKLQSRNIGYRNLRPQSCRSANAHTQTFRLAIWAADNGHSLSAIFPVSPSPTGHFGNEKSGTDFGKGGGSDGSRRDRPGECAAKGWFAGRIKRPLRPSPRASRRCSCFAPFRAFRWVCEAGCSPFRPGRGRTTRAFLSVPVRS